MGMISVIKKWVNSLFGKQNLEKAFDIKIATSGAMLEAQELWRKVYQGSAPWNIGPDGVPSQHTASALCSRVAKTTALELEWDISGSPMADYIKAQFAPFMDGARNGLRCAIEKGCKGGKLLIFPTLRGETISLDTLENNYYFPVRYDEFGRLVGIVTQSHIEREGVVYTLLGHFDYAGDKNEIAITYKAYKSIKNHSAASMGTEVSLTSVGEWADLEPETVITGVTRPWFTEFIMPQNNWIEENSRDGVSLFSKAVDLIRKLDEQKNRTEWEFEGGELAVDVPVDMWVDIGRKDPLNPRGGEVRLSVPKGKERLFRNTGVESRDLKPTVFSPALRNDALEAGSNEIKRDIEDVCEVARGTISDVSLQAKTATEIISAEKNTYTTIGDIQKAMGYTLLEVAEIVREMAYAYDLADMGEYTFTLNWGDGVPEDDDKIFARVLHLYSSGLLKPEVALAKVLKIPIDEARGLLPNISEV